MTFFTAVRTLRSAGNGRRRRWLHGRVLPILLLAGLAGCGPASQPPAPEVLASMPQCALPTGVHLLGSIGELTRALYGNQIDAEPTLVVPGGLRAVVVVASDKPSAGHTLELANASYAADTLTLEVAEHAPAPGAISAQVMTRPCLAVGIPPAGYAIVVVRNQTTTLATLPMPTP